MLPQLITLIEAIEKIDKTILNVYIQNYDKNNEIEQNVKNNKNLVNENNNFELQSCRNKQKGSGLSEYSCNSNVKGFIDVMLTTSAIIYFLRLFVVVDLNFLVLIE